MSVVEAIAALIAAVGGFGGLAALIKALPGKKPEDPDGSATPPPAPPLGSGVARWCAAMGVGAGLLAATLVVVVGATDLALNQLPLALLESGIVAFAALAIYMGARTLRIAVPVRQVELLLYAGSGLVAAVGAFAAMLVAATN